MVATITSKSLACERKEVCLDVSFVVLVDAPVSSSRDTILSDTLLVRARRPTVSLNAVQRQTTNQQPEEPKAQNGKITNTNANPKTVEDCRLHSYTSHGVSFKHKSSTEKRIGYHFHKGCYHHHVRQLLHGVDDAQWNGGALCSIICRSC